MFTVARLLVSFVNMCVRAWACFCSRALFVPSARTSGGTTQGWCCWRSITPCSITCPTLLTHSTATNEPFGFFSSPPVGGGKWRPSSAWALLLSVTWLCLQQEEQLEDLPFHPLNFRNGNPPKDDVIFNKWLACQDRLPLRWQDSHLT